ncbi:MAG: rieske [2Fe-2S] domain protein [Rhodospirillales bacterium]|jgi:phenylpropionate dioxygenase-like ring-hydroxylating dioxygenase large terminal subunit|nr:rieske [2Fe-2S] domain protein [Rhodospirillales bacterium]
MTTAAENEILTHVGPGTPMGELMRQYWMPALKSSELVRDGEPVRFRLLCENLIAFRDTSGRVGVMDHRCPHRCASLFFGRNEEGGIRCVYHGWKFDVDGNCLDMANVPPHQDFKHKVHAKTYKSAERNGIVYVYMGKADEAPPLPPVEVTLVPESQVNITFVHRDCNWLQGVEGELDTSHIGFLHLGTVANDDYEDGERSGNRFAVMNRTPEYVSSETDFGFMYAAYRPAEAGETYWRFGQFLFPMWTMPPIGTIAKNILTRAYVPIDDNNTMIVVIEKIGFNDMNTDSEAVRRQAPGGEFHFEPNTTEWTGRWKLKETWKNDYLVDRDMQRNLNYTGLLGFILQDQMITESMGAISDRTWEHLAPSDVAITKTRRVLVKAAQAYAKDGTLPKSARDPRCFEGVRGGWFVEQEGVDWQDGYRKQLANAPLTYDDVQAAE